MCQMTWIRRHDGMGSGILSRYKPWCSLDLLDEIEIIQIAFRTKIILMFGGR